MQRHEQLRREPPATDMRGRTTRVLVVDDDPGVRGLVDDFLGLLGYVVHPAANGREALEHLQRIRPDLILLDLMMPVMDGRAFGAALRGDERTVDLPIVLMSGAPEAAQVGGEIRAQGLLRKPFDLADLASVVEQVR
jgi:CheY-like chemotaxis protein